MVNSIISLEINMRESGLTTKEKAKENCILKMIVSLKAFSKMTKSIQENLKTKRTICLRIT